MNSNDDISNYLISSGDEDIDELNRIHMEKLKNIVNKKGLHNDVSKYGIVESYKVNEIISFNIRSFRHFYQLRTSKRALKEIRNLAELMYLMLPEEYNIFMEDLMKGDDI